MLIGQCLAEVADRVDTAFTPSEYVALLLIGGYGRGEGGVEVVDGRERPHNNLDFLMLTAKTSSTAQQGLRARLVGCLVPVMRAYDIEIDVSVVSMTKLALSPNLMIWYDVRDGHRPIVGDPSYRKAFERFTAEGIPGREARNLLVNRGTLLVVNDELLAAGDPDEPDRRRVVRNIAKALIGYGDAWLFFHGIYHWSYAEKLRRMTDCDAAPPALRAHYREAAEFRFRPDYPRHTARDLLSWMDEVRSVVEPVHLECERRRLGNPRLTWATYAKGAIGHMEDATSWREWARRLRNTLRSRPLPGEGWSLLERAAYRTLGPRDHLSLVFPGVAYDAHDPAYRRLTQAILAAETDDPSALRRAYLRLWCREGDINAGSLLRKWSLPGDGSADAGTGEADAK